MNIVRVIRRGRKNSRVLLEDGTQLLVTNAEVTMGVSLGCQATDRKIDAWKEFELIRKMLIAYLRKTQTCLPKAVSEDDVVSEIFLSFWEKNYWGKYDKTICPSYPKFIFIGVRNFIVSYTNKSSRSKLYSEYSLNAPVISAEGKVVEFQDMLPDHENMEENVMAKMVIESALKIVETMGESGLANLTYVELFKMLASGKKQSEIAKERGFSEATISVRKNQMFQLLKDSFAC